jgi:hypothetical protein
MRALCWHGKGDDPKIEDSRCVILHVSRCARDFPRQERRLRQNIVFHLS